MRKASGITPFRPDSNYPGQLVAWASSYILVTYRTGMVCAYPVLSTILLPVGMSTGKGGLAQVWLTQELKRLGQAMLEDLACLGITGGWKPKCMPRERPPNPRSKKKRVEVAGCAVGGHASRCRCHEGLPVTHYGPRNWKWRAAVSLSFISPARVRPWEDAFAPGQGDDRVVIGKLVKVDIGRGETIEAMVPKTTGRA